MDDKAIIDQIISIFETQRQSCDVESINVTSNYRDKREWCEHILTAFKVFGYNDNSICLGPDQYSWHGRKCASGSTLHTLEIPLKKEVSISNYCIVEINSLYTRALTQLFDDKNMWSHPGVLWLLKAVVGRAIKKRLWDLKKMYLWVDIKLFTNMVYGMVNCPDSSLQLDRVFNIDVFNAWCRNIVQEVIDKTGYGEDVVAIVIDTILFNHELVEIESKLLDDPNAWVDSSDNSIYSLNRICRKFKIDIVR